MSMRDLLHEAFRALESNRGRSLLTILGIVIGIGSVIAMTSLIGGIQNNLVGTLGLNAARTVTISAADNLTESELSRLRALLPAYESIEGGYSTGKQLSENGKTLDVGINGYSTTLATTKGADKMSVGANFTKSDDTAAKRVCTIDRNMVKFLFKGSEESALGQTITLGSNSYRVVGVRPEAPSSSDYSEVIIPQQTFAKDFPSDAESYGDVVGLAKEGADMDQIVSDTKTALAKVLGYDEKTAEDNMMVYSQKNEIDSMNQYMGAFSLIMGCVAGISLLVGGIGIMNMMLTNVTERIREIGIRRALGATRHDITTQFLAESSVLCMSGGVIGVIIGYILSWILSMGAASAGILASMGGEESAGLTPAFSPQTILLALGISVFIGVVFGYYPARRAARLDPVECLRYQ